MLVIKERKKELGELGAPFYDTSKLSAMATESAKKAKAEEDRLIKIATDAMSSFKKSVESCVKNQSCTPQMLSGYINKLKSEVKEVDTSNLYSMAGQIIKKQNELKAKIAKGSKEDKVKADKAKADIAKAEKIIKQTEVATDAAKKIASQASTASKSVQQSAANIRQFAGLSGFGDDGQSEQYYDEQAQESSQEQYQEPSQEQYYDEQIPEQRGFNIEVAKQDVAKMKKNIETIQNAVTKGKQEIAKGRQQIADARKQIAAI